VDFVKALLNHNDKDVTGIYARWHIFEEKREAVLAIEAAYSVRATNANSPISEPSATTIIARKNSPMPDAAKLSGAFLLRIRVRIVRTVS
jgi:hypothetical protein